MLKVITKINYFLVILLSITVNTSKKIKIFFFSEGAKHIKNIIKLMRF